MTKQTPQLPEDHCLQQYNVTAQNVARMITLDYSTSFGIASRMFPPRVKGAIQSIYAMARVADEIVDSYGGDDASQVLVDYESAIYTALQRGYSTDLVIHAFVQTAGQYGINRALIAPFFASMQLDCANKYQTTDYQSYIYGSAGVIGLMCLKVFVAGDDARFKELAPGAEALASAFQKINFLRDLADDYNRLGRYYFPVDSFKTFTEQTKQAIIADITTDLNRAKPAIDALPSDCQTAVAAAYAYFDALLQKLHKTSVATIKKHRTRINNGSKLLLLLAVIIRRALKI